MALSWKARRRWSLAILVIGLPLYIAAAVTVVNWLGRPSLWVELMVYVVLGIVWALPFRSVFRGIGRDDPGRAGPGNAGDADARDGDRRG